MKKHLSFLTLASFLLTAFGTSITPARADDESQNAKAFLTKVTRAKEGGGAGNGGNTLISDFFKMALVGLKKLEIIEKGTSEGLAAKIRLKMEGVKVYPVDFNLCADDSRSDCADDIAYAAKNYPDQKIILLDGRDLSKKWLRLSRGERERLSVHEFAGIAHAEVENHLLTAEIDDEETFKSFDNRKDRKAYLKLLNDYFFLLPGSDAAEFDGTYVLKTQLSVGRYAYTNDPTKMVKSDKYALKILATSDKNTKPDQNGDVPVLVWDVSKSFRLVGTQDIEFMTGDCTSAFYSNRTLICGRSPYPTGGNGLIWAGRTRSLFEPSFNTDYLRDIPALTCKKTDTTRMLCRHVRQVQLPFDDGYPVREYLFYSSP